MRETDVAKAETLLRLIQSVPSPKAKPIILRTAEAKVGKERTDHHSSNAEHAHVAP